MTFPLPSAELAKLNIEKLTNYCLSGIHPDGKHKARLFKAALGLGVADAFWLRSEILRQLPTADAVEQATDAFGTRYSADMQITKGEKSATVRTVWICESPEVAPRFVTCWII